jgi:hypothetical protein
MEGAPEVRYGEPSIPKPAPEQKTASHLVVLTVCLSIIALALVLKPQGSHLQVGPATLPGLCVLKQTTGIPCPGCGLTRSVVSAVHGNWEASRSFHRLGPVVLVFVLLQVFYRLVWLGLPAFRSKLDRVGRILDLALLPLMVLMFINWIPTLLETFGWM